MNLLFEVAGKLGFELEAELCKRKSVGNWGPALFGFYTIISSVAAVEGAMDMVVAVGGESFLTIDLAGKVGGDGFFFVIGSEGFECSAIEIAAPKGRRDGVD